MKKKSNRSAEAPKRGEMRREYGFDYRKARRNRSIPCFDR